ncbi:hypothetical protein [Roseivivax isoporae]|uniref:Uncharacterized protein n=1 Tax=Roseivivax isoporae LMG 25204 TaxID=1449351 RepID=X7FFI2_9RHOB|nr:hypothetical protein [Roseivivax isoporae]ETX30794.1 hypothetical protein RISW2_07305 [Roseivivax isoporae LMG 25204]
MTDPRPIRPAAVPLADLFRRLSTEILRLEEDGLVVEDWITRSLQAGAAGPSMDPLTLQRLDRKLQTLRELGELLEKVAETVPPGLALDIGELLQGLRLRDLARALDGQDHARPGAADGEVDFF